MAKFSEDIQCAGSEHHEVHEMHDDVQPNYVIVSYTEYTGDSNMIPYDQYVKDNAEPVVRNNASSVSNDASMIIINEMPKLTPRCDSVKEHTKVVDASLTTELAIYKEQVELYERRAKFKLTVREQKIDEQLRIVITERNIKEENLKKELHSVKMQLQSTINHNKSMAEEVTSLKKDFKQKENKYLKEFLDMKALKEKVEDILFKQDQSLQTIHMLCKPKPYYDEQRKIFWSKDVLKMKTEALAKQAKAAKLVRALTVYPPNTPVKLVPRVLPTKNQVKINIFALIQLFLEFEKICKTRITPTGLIEGESGFEETKECYLTELKYEHLKESLGNNNSLPTQDGPDFDSVFEINKLKASIQGKDNAIRKLRMQISQFQETRSEADHSVTPKVFAPGMYAIDVEPIPPRCRNNREVHLEHLKHLKESVATIHEIVDEARLERPLDSSLASACLSGLVQNLISLTPYIPPSKKDYETLFQPLFDEYFNPLPHAVSLVPTAVAAPRAVDPAGLPSSTIIDRDVP
nr:hypothetical protein [Tanacetum cinerariifolium]